MKEAQQIKGLKSQLKKAYGDLESIKTEVSNKQREQNLKQGSINKLKESIDKLEGDGKIIVTEHAVLRYLERVKGIDLQEIEEEILNPKVLELISALGGNAKFPSPGFKIVMRDFKVVTIEV